MEHLHHFGLGRDPFNNEPDLRCFFESVSHCDAQRRVERGLRQSKGMTLLTGEGGTGKTLLTRRILEALEEEIFEAVLLVMLPGAADATSILQRFARQLGCDDPVADRAGLLAQLYEHLAIVREDGRHAVLIVDDAQVMGPEVFAQICGLLNLEYEDRGLLSILFVGSPELDRLVNDDPRVLPRVDVRVSLRPFDLPNASAYVRHRVTGVGGDPEIIPASAMDSLHKFGRGRPRLLNTLADNALFEAYLGGRKAIDPSDVERAAADLGIGPDPGMTYPQLPIAPAPATRLAVGSSPTVDALTPTLDLDESLADLDLSAALDSDVPILDLDEGLEDALAEFEVVAPEALGEQLVDALEFDVEPPAAPSTPVAEEIGEFLLAEADLMPLEAGEGDALDDAFVELIEE